MPATTKKLNRVAPFQADPPPWNYIISMQPLELHLFKPLFKSAIVLI